MNGRPYGTALFLVIAAAAILLLLGSARSPLTDPDESRFARTSVEMLRRGDPVVPTFEGVPRLVKPPLLHWLQAPLFHVLGAGPFAARLPAMAATLGSLLLVVLVARRRYGGEAAVWSAAVFATMPLVLVSGKIGTLDALLGVHVLGVIALDMLSFETRSSGASPVEGVAEPSRRGLRAAAAGALLGLAFLAKGPVGVVLPLVVMLAGRTATGRPVLPTARCAAAAVAAWCAVVLPWGLAFVGRIGESDVWQTLRREVFERYFAGTEHVEPSWFYVKVIFAALLPWSPALVVGATRLLVGRDRAEARTAVYAAAGLAAGVVFFSLGQGKLASYVLPLAPLAALIVTWELGREFEAPAKRLAPALTAATLAVSTALLAWAATELALPEGRRLAALGTFLFGAAAVVAFAGVGLRRPRWVHAAAAAATAGVLAGTGSGLFPAVASQRSAAPLVAAVPELRSERPVVTVDMHVPSLAFYLDRIPESVDLRSIDARLARDDASLFVLAEQDLRRFGPRRMDGLREVGRGGKYRVLEKSPPRGPDRGPDRDESRANNQPPVLLDAHPGPG